MSFWVRNELLHCSQYSKQHELLVLVGTPRPPDSTGAMWRGQIDATCIVGLHCIESIISLGTHFFFSKR